MIYLNFVLFISYIILFCNGCLPTPTVEPGPTVTLVTVTPTTTTTTTTCPPNTCSLSGSRTLITPTADAACAYTAEATCTVTGIAQATIRFNGAPPDVAFPQTLTCDSGTGLYTYLMAGVPTPVTSIECICGGDNCGWTAGGGAMTNPLGGAGTADANCIYYRDAYCALPSQLVIEFGPAPIRTFSVPKEVYCPAGYTGFLYLDAGGVEREIFGANCPP